MKISGGILTSFILSAAATERVNVNLLMQNALMVENKSILKGRKLSYTSPVTASKSIQFNSCVSVTTQPWDEDIFYGQTNLAAAQNGKIISEHSYVLFNLCDTGSCVYESDENLYMVDLKSYLRSLLSYYPYKKQRVCTVCEASQEYCGEYYTKKIEYYQQKYQYEQDQQNAAQDQQNSGYRQLYNSNSAYMANRSDGGHVNKVTCDQCVQECYEEGGDIWQSKLQAEMYASGKISQYEDGNNYSNQASASQEEEEEIEFDSLAEWVAEITSCKELGYVYNNQNLYAGFMCNSDGSGVEIGLFLDEYCSIYTKEQSFSAAATSSGGDELTYASQANKIVTYPFINNIDCGDTMTFATPWGAVQNNGNYYSSVSSYCTNLFGSNAINLDDCNDAGSSSGNQNKYQQQNYNDNGYQSIYDYTFYKYMLSQKDLRAPGTVCSVVKKSQGQQKSIFDSSQGSVYDYSVRQQMIKEQRNAMKGDRKGLKMFGLFFGFAMAVWALVAYFKGSLVAGDSFPDPKKEQLVIEGDKAYAREFS